MGSDAASGGNKQVWSRERLERKRLAKYPEEVGLVFLRELLHGEVKFMLLNRPGIVNDLNEESGGMEFYFPLKDRMYHWVRSSSLYSPAARQRGITVKTMFRQEEIGASVPVFDRLETGFYFRKLHSLCLSAGVP